MCQWSYQFCQIVPQCTTGYRRVPQCSTVHLYHTVLWGTAVYQGLPQCSSGTTVYPIVQCGRLVNHATLWYPVVPSGTLWYTVVHCGTLWYNVAKLVRPLAHLRTLWYTLLHCVIPWHTDTSWTPVVHCVTCGTLYTVVHVVEWYPMVYCSTLWYTVILNSTIWYTVVPDGTLWHPKGTVVLHGSLYPILHCDMLRYPMVPRYRGTLWYTVVNCNTLWFPVAHCGTPGTLWYTGTS